MDNILSIDVEFPADIIRLLASNVKSRRLELNLTQAALARRAGIKLPTYRRFERTGEISLMGLLQIAFTLDCLDDFKSLFTRKKYQSLDELLDEKRITRKRGMTNE